MALGPKVKIRRVSHPRYNWLATYREAGSLRKKYFLTRKKADDWAQNREEEALNHGTSLPLSDEERSAVTELRSELTAIGVPLRDALQFAIGHYRQLQQSVPVSHLIDEFKREKSNVGVSLRYVQDIRSRLGCFEKSFGNRNVATVTSVEIEDWLRKMKLSAVSQNNYRRLLVGLFNSAKRRRYCESNPAEEVPTAKTIKKPVGILTPTQAEELLHQADPAIRPVVALGLFAGIRMEELEKLGWKNVDPLTGHVEIEAAMAKSAKRRLVPIRENLRTWIESAPVKEGQVWPSNGRKLLREAKRAAGFGGPDALTEKEKQAGKSLMPWPNNALRHSFASYHLAKFRNSEELALEMGHTDTKIIFEHYRELVRPEEAEAFWNIHAKET